MKMLWTLLMSTTLLACQQNGNAVQTDFSEPLVIRDLAYGKDSLQKMDVYLPAGRTVEKTKSMILVHGGSWNGGSKSDFNSYVDSMRRRLPDYAFFNLNYRLLNGGHIFPAQENDVKQAVDFIVANSESYGINTSKFVMLGASAGGHLAMLQAYKHQQPKIAAVIDFFGPTDLTAMYRKPSHPYLPIALQLVTGTTPDASPQLFQEWSPIAQVSPQSPPMLILHGSKDPVVPVSQSQQLKAALEKNAVKHELVIYPSQRHGWYGTLLSNSFDRMEIFLAQNVK